MRHFAKAMFDAGHVQVSDREDTGIASGTRNSQQVQEPRANARRLIDSLTAERLAGRIQVRQLCQGNVRRSLRTSLRS